MISGRTIVILAYVYSAWFVAERNGLNRKDTLDSERLYLHLRRHNYPVEFCYEARRMSTTGGLRNLIIQLHSREYLYGHDDTWASKERQAEGRRLLQRLAEDFLQHYDGEDAIWQLQFVSLRQDLVQCLGEDGFEYLDGFLLPRL